MRQQGFPRTRRDEGFAMSSPVALMSGAAITLAAVAFFVTDRPTVDEPGAATLAAAPAPVERRVTFEPVRRKPVVEREAVYVAVYNNSNVTGLASRTATRITSAGWQVVDTDNWFGTIPATTVYFPERLEAAARMLSKDLGIERVVPAVDPMSMDRLTVILTADYTG